MKGYFYQECVPNPDRWGIPGHQVVKVNVTKSSLQSDMFLNIKPNFSVKWGFWKKKGKTWTFFFLFFIIYIPLQRAPEGRLCILSVRRCHDYFRKPFLWRYSAHTSRLRGSAARTTMETAQLTVVLSNIWTSTCQFGFSLLWRLKPCCWKGPQCSPATTTDKDSLARLPSFNTQLKTHFFLNLHLTGGLLSL